MKHFGTLCIKGLRRDLAFFFHFLIIQFHDTPDSKSEQSKEKTGVPVKPHSSRVTSVSACNCGRTQGSREDPFDLKVSFCYLEPVLEHMIKVNNKGSKSKSLDITLVSLSLT